MRQDFEWIGVDPGVRKYVLPWPEETVQLNRVGAHQAFPGRVFRVGYSVTRKREIASEIINPQEAERARRILWRWVLIGQGRCS